MSEKEEFIWILFEEERVCSYGYYLRKKEWVYMSIIWGRKSVFICILFVEERSVYMDIGRERKGEFMVILFGERVGWYWYFLRDKVCVYMDNIWGEKGLVCNNNMCRRRMSLWKSNWCVCVTLN